MKHITIAISLLLSGCLSFDAAGERWDAWVDEHNSCEIADDCVVVYTSCPLGCWTTVNASFEDEAHEVADDLVRRVEAGGANCAYDCAQNGAPTCEAGTCQVDALPFE